MVAKRCVKVSKSCGGGGGSCTKCVNRLVKGIMVVKAEVEKCNRKYYFVGKKEAE